MSTPEQQLEAAKSIISDVLEYFADRFTIHDSETRELGERMEAFLEETK